MFTVVDAEHHDIFSRPRNGSEQLGLTRFKQPTDASELLLLVNAFPSHIFLRLLRSLERCTTRLNKGLHTRQVRRIAPPQVAAGYLRHIDDLILGAQETDSLLFLPCESDKPHSVLRDGENLVRDLPNSPSGLSPLNRRRELIDRGYQRP